MNESGTAYMSLSDEEVINAYLQHVDGVLNDDGVRREDPHQAAWEAVEELVRYDPDRAWRVLVTAIQRCSPGGEYIIGAGPLEQLLVMHPGTFADRVADLLQTDERFRAAFASVWLSTEYCGEIAASEFNRTLERRGVPPHMLPYWRIADDDDPA